jgi:hypothetical protein
LLRVEKLIANKGEDACQTAIDIVRAYASDAADRVAISARNLAAALDEPEKLEGAFERLAPQRPINAIQARRNIADSMIEAGRYLW